MDHKDDWGTDFFLWGFGLVFGVVALADVLGRLSRVLIREWPLISWGLAILFMTGAVIWVAIKLNAALAKHVAQVEEKIRFHENRLRGMNNHIERFEKQLSDIGQDIRAYRSDCYHFIKRLDEVAALKAPPQAPAVKSTDAIQAAAREITGGAA